MNELYHSQMIAGWEQMLRSVWLDRYMAPAGVWRAAERERIRWCVAEIRGHRAALALLRSGWGFISAD